jgi:putative ABC transport system permease protein
LLDYLGMDPAEIDDDTILLTGQAGDVFLTGDITSTRFRNDPVPDAQVETIDVRDYSSSPRTLITDAGLAAANLEPMRAGWLLQLSTPVEPSALAEARAVADEAGLAVETRNGREGQAMVRTVAATIGVLIALCILAMTVGLLRSDAAHDLRVLAATGASGRTRRSLTATTSVVLAELGVILGMSASYAALIAAYWPDTDRLGNVPVAHLAVIAFGLPLLAGAAAWMLGGRGVGDLARAID